MNLSKKSFAMHRKCMIARIISSFVPVFIVRMISCFSEVGMLLFLITAIISFLLCTEMLLRLIAVIISYLVIS